MNVGNRTAERRRAAKRSCVTGLLVESFVVIFNNNDPLYGYLRTSFSSRVSHQIVERNRRILFCVATLLASSNNHDDDEGKKKINKEAAVLLKQKLGMQYIFWQISLPSSHD